MYVIVVGAGLESRCLIDLLTQHGHEVALIEADREAARKVLECHDIAVFNADIGMGGVLDEAQASRADAMIATTSDDSRNLMAMFLGKENNIKTLISMVNEQEHQRLFERLGVQVLVNPETIIAKSLYQMLPQS